MHAGTMRTADRDAGIPAAESYASVWTVARAAGDRPADPEVR